MAKRRQVALMRKSAEKGEMSPLGPCGQVRDTLARYNTSGDGGPARSSGMETLYGPGMVVEVPSASPTVNQAMVTLSDEELAMPVLMRMCREQSWQMVDLESGRVFG